MLYVSALFRECRLQGFEAHLAHLAEVLDHVQIVSRHLALLLCRLRRLRLLRLGSQSSQTGFREMDNLRPRVEQDIALSVRV